jgi:PilZ domain-containing protein
VDESPIAKVEAVTENVSPQGARVITDSICAPGKLVRLDAPAEHLQLPARVVYCQRLEERKFAVGLQLEVRIERWKEQV